MARSYIALLRKDKDSDYGVEFPDFPGCVTAGKSLDEAQAFAKEALELHLRGLVEDGQEIPEPSSVDAIFEGRWPTKGTVPFLVTPKALRPKVVRVNLTFHPEVLEDLDGLASDEGITRSAAVERAIGGFLYATEKSSGGTLRVKAARRKGARQKKAHG